MSEPIRIANCSGFYGDRLSAAKEMVDGGPIDVLTGDWLAELTMLILARTQLKHPGSGYARTFVTQMEQVMGTCLDRGIKVVSNAGGLNPAACAEAVAQVANTLGLVPTIAFVNGDDLLPRLEELRDAGHLTAFDSNETIDDISSLITANAYLGCFGIAEALSMGADIVITGRVTDAALVCGPAAWHHDWRRDHFDELAGAVVAGHVIECGAQV
ncbi:MAG TPA: acyclic terpene utilization AtuA family protein, partial [Acidimicrobiales bacterium]|nr:acyclic terpene utilization AtuA family protein [Acidimicrobiales bacterium]